MGHKTQIKSAIMRHMKYSIVTEDLSWLAQAIVYNMTSLCKHRRNHPYQRVHRVNI